MILVTGAAGLIGSHLCDWLIAGGQQVVGLDNLSTGDRENLAQLAGHPRFALEVADVTAPIERVADEIYHLACPASPLHYQRDPVGTIRTCVDGTLRVLDCAQRTGARVVIASTSEVYGDPIAHPQRETDFGNVNPIGPRACYDEGKRCAEALAVSFARQYGCDVRIARIFNVYGPRSAVGDGRVVPNFIVQALRGEPLTVYGRGEQTRSFCYVTDLVAALVSLMALPRAAEVQPINLGNPVEITIGELARRIVALTGSASTVVHYPLPTDDPTRRLPDITRARAVLGWDPRVPLDEGLTRTIEDLRDRVTPRQSALSST
jgi:UDP-glucuronate decarboxylase